MRVGYLTSVYPAISHTFVRREIEALRRREIEVETFTIRRSPDFDALSELDQEEYRRTWAILPAKALELLGGHASALISNPRRYAGALALAMRHRVPGAKNGLWALFHFTEGVYLAREMKKRGVEHLHCHFGNAGATIAMLAAEVAGIGFSVALHGSPCFDGLRSLLGEKVSKAEFVACVSNYGRAQAHWASEPQYWDRIALVRCGIEVEALASSAKAKTARARPRVITVARLSPEKGLLGLVGAFAEALERGADADLRIIGEGPERKRIEARVKELGLEARVEMPGHASHTRVLEEIGDADVFALASFMEGLPVVLMEAMALGVPVVAPRLTGIPELVEDGSSGLLFTPAVWSELADQMTKLLRDEKLRASLADRARGRVRAEFDSDKAVEPLLTRFKNAIENRSAK